MPKKQKLLILLDVETSFSPKPHGWILSWECQPRICYLRRTVEMNFHNFFHSFFSGKPKMPKTPKVKTDQRVQILYCPKLPAWLFASEVQSTALYLRNNTDRKKSDAVLQSECWYGKASSYFSTTLGLTSPIKVSIICFRHVEDYDYWSLLGFSVLSES